MFLVGSGGFLRFYLRAYGTSVDIPSDRLPIAIHRVIDMYVSVYFDEFYIKKCSSYVVSCEFAEFRVDTPLCKLRTTSIARL